MIKIQFFILAIIGTFLIGNASNAQTTIRLCNHMVEANQQIVSLGDVATIKNASPKLYNKLASLELGMLEGAASDQVYQLSKREVALSLRLAGLPRDEFQVTGPDIVQVAYLSEMQQVKRLEDSIQTWIANTYGIENGDLQVTIQPTFQLTDDMAVPASPTFASLNQTKLPLGRQNVTMMLPLKNKRSSKPQSIPVMVELMREVAVAAQNIPEGTKISAGDVRTVKRPFTTTNQSWYDATQVIGNYARKNIAKYELIDSQMLQDRSQMQKMVKKNQLIEAVLKHGAFEIKLKNVRALQDGNEGDSIEIVSLQTGRHFRATVIGSGSVEIK